MEKERLAEYLEQVPHGSSQRRHQPGSWKLTFASKGFRF